MDEQLFVDDAFDIELAKPLGIKSDDNHADWDIELLVEQIYHELEGVVDKEVVDRVVREMSSRYRQAKVKAFVPIFIRRDAIDRLRRL